MAEAKEQRQKHSPKGRVITFYSYKGGTGRSMAVANIAWMLALSGERVLIIDWDLEAPGIHRYFHPFLDDKELSDTEGLLDFVEKLAGRSAVAEKPLSDDEVDIVEYIKVLNWPSGSSLRWDAFGPFSGIDLLTAGRQGPSYGQKLNSFNWIDFYEKLDGRRLLNVARQQMTNTYDYVLIDSRTGVSDTSGICTVEMPDSVVVCFTLNDQSIKGASGVAESVLRQWKTQFSTASQARSATATAGAKDSPQEPAGAASNLTPSGAATAAGGFSRPMLRIFPVPTRVEIVSERAKREVALALAQQKFSSFLDHLPREIRNRYWLRVQLPYFPFYAFEEIPAVFGDPASDELSLSTPLKHIARYVTDSPYLEIVPLNKDDDEAERLRKEILGWYVRKGLTGPQDAVQVAQSCYEQLDRTDQLWMRKVMLRLVQVVAGSPPSLGTVPLEDFEPPLDAIVQTLAKNSLLQISGNSVFIADRRIVENWDLLRRWLNEDSEFLFWRQKLAVSARSWRDHHYDESVLLRGALLKEAMEWMDKRPEDLTRPERDFISASRKAGEGSRFSWQRISAIAGFLAILIGIGTLWYVRKLDQDRQKAARNALIINTAEKSGNNTLTTVLLLTELEDYKASEKELSFASNIANSWYPEMRLYSDGILRRLEFSPNGKLLVGAGDHGAELWDSSTWKKVGLIGNQQSLSSASFNAWAPDRAKQRGGSGTTDRIVTTGTDGLVKVWTLDGKQVMQIDAEKLTSSFFQSCVTPGASSKLTFSEINNLGRPQYARFSPDDAVVMIAYVNGPVVMVSPETGRCFDVYDQPSQGTPIFSHDGEWIATFKGAHTAGENNYLVITLFHTQDWKQSSYSIPITSGTKLQALSTNQSVVMGSQDSRAVWDLSNHSERALSCFNDTIFQRAVSKAIFSWDGSLVGSSGYKNSVCLDKNVTDQKEPPIYALSNGASGITFDPAGKYLLAAEGSTVSILPVKKTPLPASASWEEVILYLKSSTKTCLTPEERSDLLNESKQEAVWNSQQCEASRK